eukprot:20020-Eustigmatos_ZCMA.PRE.1
MAATGAGGLRGRVLMVCGVAEKLEAARAAGLRKVLVPAEAMKAWLKLNVSPVLRQYGESVLQPVHHVTEAI